ncbi:hypothetical protein AB0395_17655 [Streptosporangium sp. NPDC051023]|uniref:hypothetical protein n=1 Tax=Streptosporangium sp. NPDC051023 TaxID=3155410 RepID=UPI00344B986C
MGRHGGHGEDAPRSRGKREPESVPQPETRDEPIGRRLRPEESAVTEPTKGFLGSGWSAESELSDPVRPDREHRRKGRAKLALLTAAAVAMLLGGSVAGIQLMSGPADSTTACPPGGCVAGASNQPAPETLLTEEEPPPSEEPPASEEPVPTEKPAEGKRDTDTPPPPAPVTTPRHVGRTPGAKPSPTPRATHTPRRTQQAQPTEEPVPTPEPTGEALVSGNQTHGPSEPSGAPAPTPTPAPTSTAPASGAGVTVGFGLVKEKDQVYTAQLVIATDEKLDGLTLKVPIGGAVTSVTGATWKQVGDTLVIESTENLNEGEHLVVTFTADGQARTPQTCQSSPGNCVVV